jgi:putative methyltransferase
MKHNIYLAQFSLTITPGNINFMPYAVASVWSYAQTFLDVNAKYDMKEIFFEKVPPKKVIKNLDNPKVFAFGCYVWNCNYTDEVARMVKEKYPDCLIVYGGPHLPLDPPGTPESGLVPENHNGAEHGEWWNKHDYVDVICYYEGEKRFTKILQSDTKEEMSLIPNVSVNLDSGWTWNLDYTSVGKDRINDLSLIPSPYLLGLFPRPKRNHIPIMETTRGCPYACTFCDLGAKNHNKVYKKELGRIQEELDWMVKHKMGSFYYVDNNFGLFKDRDDEIIDMVIATKKKHGYPRNFFVNWAKNHKSEFVDMAKKLYDADILQSICLSIQSRNDEVLTRIKRGRMGVSDFKYYIGKCRDIGLPYSTELILGNPGETVESWKDGYIDVVRSGVNCDIYACALLPGAELSSAKSREENGIEHALVQFPGVANPKYRPVREYMEQIIGTKWMSKEDMRDIVAWTWCTRLGHEFNFTREIANYCEMNDIIDLLGFYDKFYEYISQGSGVLNQYFNNHLLFRTNNYEYTLALKNVGFKDTLSLDDRDLVKEDIEIFASQFDIPEELIKFNDASMFRGDVRYPWRIKFDYDFINHKEDKVEIEFTTTGMGRAAATRDNLIHGMATVSEDYKYKKKMVCTRTSGKII